MWFSSRVPTLIHWQCVEALNSEDTIIRELFFSFGMISSVSRPSDCLKRLKKSISGQKNKYIVSEIFNTSGNIKLINISVPIKFVIMCSTTPPLNSQKSNKCQICMNCNIFDMMRGGRACKSAWSLEYALKGPPE